MSDGEVDIYILTDEVAEVIAARSSVRRTSNPWVKMSERVPDEDGDYVVAYLIEGEWYIDSANYKPSYWSPPHMRTPDYWATVASLAPPAFEVST